MKLSIIVLNYKSKNLVKYFLKKVVTFDFNFDWEIIVVDNYSQDGIKKMITKEFPQVTFIQNNKNLGMGAGNNVGIRASKGQNILIVNPDVTLNQESIQAMIEFFNAHPQTAIVGPRINNPDGTRQDTTFRWPKFITFLYRRTWLGKTKQGRAHSNFYLYKNQKLNEPRQVDWVLGGCFMVRRRAIDKVGLFDENFFLFLEDTDLCRRMKQASWEIWYYPAATAIHLPHRLSQEGQFLKEIFSPLTWIHIKSWLYYFWKWRKANL